MKLQLETLKHNIHLNKVVFATDIELALAHDIKKLMDYYTFVRHQRMQQLVERAERSAEE